MLPKEGKSKFNIKNWRRITLLNIVYKIGSGCTAQRKKDLLEKIICIDQTRFIPGWELHRRKYKINILT